MGFNISWLAFRGGGRAASLRALQLHIAGQAQEWPDGHLLFGTLLPDETYVIFINDCFHRLVGAEVLASASRRGELVGCQVEEHIMTSASFCWKNGKQIWDVTHESEKGVRDLNIAGAPPPELLTLRQKAETEQEDERPFAVSADFNAQIDHFFRIPIDLAAIAVGYEHDKVLYPWGQPMYEPLIEAKPS